MVRPLILPSDSDGPRLSLQEAFRKNLVIVGIHKIQIRKNHLVWWKLKFCPRGKESGLKNVRSR